MIRYIAVVIDANRSHIIMSEERVRLKRQRKDIHTTLRNEENTSKQVRQDTPLKRERKTLMPQICLDVGNNLFGLVQCTEHLDNLSSTFNDNRALFHDIFKHIGFVQLLEKLLLNKILAMLHQSK